MQPRVFFGLLLFKTWASLRAEISHYYFNFLWWFFEPILSMGVFYVVFGIFLHRGEPNFVAFLLVGLSSWNWFSQSVSNASESILGGRNLMMQIYLPKVFFPLQAVLRNTFKHLCVVTLLLAFLFFYGAPFGAALAALPLLLAVQFLLITGVSSLAAAMVPFVPDLRFVVKTGLHMLFYATGIFYNIDAVVLEKHRVYIYLNPMAGLIKNYRTVLIDGAWPDWSYMGNVTLAALGLCLVAYLFLHRFDYVYPRVCQQ